MRRNYFQNAFSENLGHPPIFDCSSDKCPELLLPLLLPQLLPESGARLASPTQSWSQSSPQHCQTTTTTEIQQQTKTKHLQASLAAQSIHQLSGRHWRNWINSFKSIHSSKKGFLVDNSTVLYAVCRSSKQHNLVFQTFWNCSEINSKLNLMIN